MTKRVLGDGATCCGEDCGACTPAAPIPVQPAVEQQLSFDDEGDDE